MEIREEKIERSKYYLRPEKKLAVRMRILDDKSQEIMPITYDEMKLDCHEKIKEIKRRYKEFLEDKTLTKEHLLFGFLFFRNWKESWEALLTRIDMPEFAGDDSDVQKAKLFPIGNLLKFNAGNFTNCIWHNEKTPSMKRYKKTNTVFCFGCQKSGDPIDVAMQLYGLEFKEAVRLLNSQEVYEA